MLEDMVRVPGLDGEKMGKSDSDNAIDINASPSEVRERYRTKGVTDIQRVRKDDSGDPYNRCRSVYPMHEMLSPAEKKGREIANSCIKGTLGCADCKNMLANKISKILGPFQERRRALETQDSHVREILREGGRHARRIIRETTAEVREKMGIKVPY
jgi:tryptophanyl-tRNA synthetase